MVQEFLLPKDPRLEWRMLVPQGHRNSGLNSRGDRTHYVFWARNAIYHGLKALKIAPGDNVLVPSFHCTSVVEPILKYGAQVKFYDIHQDLSPDIADIESKLTDRTRALLVIHYFGFPQAIETYKEIAGRHGIFLIEDCAHVLTGNTQEGSPLGSVGDIAIFSWRKFLPLYDGGQLVVNNPDLDLSIPWDKSDWFFTLKVTKNILDKLIDDSDSRVVRQMAALSRVPSFLARRLASKRGQFPKAFNVNSYDLDFDLAAANLRMSAWSRQILGRTDVKDVVDKRRQNYLRVLDVVKSYSGAAPFYPILPESICPWIFPLHVHRVKDFHLSLRDKGIPAFTWSGVIHRDLRLDKFPIPRRLYDSLVFLPIHQSILAREMDAMIGVLRQQLESLS